MCQEASLGPIRELGPAALRTIRAEEVRSLNEQVHSDSDMLCMCCLCMCLLRMCVFHGGC